MTACMCVCGCRFVFVYVHVRMFGHETNLLIHCLSVRRDVCLLIALFCQFVCVSACLLVGVHVCVCVCMPVIALYVSMVWCVYKRVGYITMCVCVCALLCMCVFVCLCACKMG